MGCLLTLFWLNRTSEVSQALIQTLNTGAEETKVTIAYRQLPSENGQEIILKCGHENAYLNTSTWNLCLITVLTR